MAERRLAAVDLGAQSGRVGIGTFDGARVSLDVAHRFVNRPVWLPDGLRWNVTQLFADVVEGLARAAAGGPLDGIGIDSWGCDYALLDRHQRILGLPFHYRDPARASGEVMARTHARVPAHELYARTGIQTMAINTVFQLVAEADGAALAGADRIALIPDLFGLWLTGTLVNEVTAASTTGLLDAQGLGWAVDVIERLGIPTRPFAGQAAAPGVGLGPVLAGHAGAGAAVGAIVRAVAGHDTASAFAAATLPGPSAAVLSSGTWSLLGVELDAPRLGAEAETFNLTNERGVGDTTRLLRNVMGMWLLEECRREWATDGPAPEYEELFAAADAAGAGVAVFDPDHDTLLHPGAMTGRIAALARATGQSAPAGRGALTRSILVSLACKYRFVLDCLQSVIDRRIEVVQVVGGGSRNRLLCQLTADLADRPVLAGPAEATLLGNTLVQLAATGELTPGLQMRELAAASTTVSHYTPRPEAGAAETYQRFLDATGLGHRRSLGATV